jgi:hypothetical protein
MTLDRRMTATGLFYIRFHGRHFSRWHPTRWKLRSAVRVVNEILGAPGREKHPERAFVGRIERGLISWATASHADRYGPRLDVYVARWMRWFQSGLGWFY